MQHTQQANGAWTQLSFSDQMANVGSEVVRAIKWREKGQPKFFQAAFYRSLELLDLTIQAQKKSSTKLKELTRLKECLIDDFGFKNTYGSTDLGWNNYFRAFNILARKS